VDYKDSFGVTFVLAFVWMLSGHLRRNHRRREPAQHPAHSPLHNNNTTANLNKLQIMTKTKTLIKHMT